MDSLVDGQFVEDGPLNEPEARVAPEAVEIAKVAGGEVVQRHHRVTPGQQGLGQVRADEPGAPSDEIAGRHPEHPRGPVW